MNENILALYSLISLGALVIFIFWLNRDYSVDSFRQQMFALRDSLFDEAADGNVEFQSPAYGMLRSTMNGLIRFGHRLSLPHVIAVSFAIEKHMKEVEHSSFSDRFEENTNTLNAEQKAMLNSYRMKMNIILVRHLVLSSPLLLITVIVPLMVSVSANLIIGRVVRAFRLPIDKLDSLALAEGEI